MEQPAIRVASPDEFGGLREMVEVADRLFESVGIGPFSGSAEDDHFMRKELTGSP